MEGETAGRLWKTELPKLPEYFIDRGGIYEKLDAKSGVFFLSGVKGSGKTSAASGYCRRRYGDAAGETDVFWHTFWKEDNAADYFCQRLCGAFPELRRKASCRDCMEALAKSSYALLVFDNVERITNPKMLRAIRFLLEMNSDKKIILIMSERPQPCFAGYMAAGHYGRICGREFFFSKEELRRLACRYGENHAGDIARLWTVTEGWPVAAACFLRAGGREDGESGQDAVPLLLSDYIEYEIYMHIPVKAQRFLAQTSALHSLDSGLCGFCTGEEAAEGLLRAARKKYLAGEDGYLPLFRRFLSEKLTAREKQELLAKESRYAAEQAAAARAPDRKEKKIRVTAFGTFHAFFTEDGKELSWRTKKGCELFAYLLHLRGQAVERKTLLKELWQEEIPNNAVAMLHNMFYNLRKQLSGYQLESIVRYRDRKYSLDTDVIEADLDRIRQAAEAVEKEQADWLLKNRQMFDAYWGRYLEDIDSRWAREEQEYYERIYEKGCLLLARAFMEDGKFETACHYLKNALSVNNYSEAAAAGLLECYGEMGDFISMRRQYDAFCGLLEKELGISPGEELRSRYLFYMKKYGGKSRKI